MDAKMNDSSIRISEGGSRKRQRISQDDDQTTSITTPVMMATTPSTTLAANTHADTKPCHHEELLKSFNVDFEAMRQLITCSICQRFLYEPYGLVCGHTFCYSCLCQWLAHNGKKTCPDCRSSISNQPTPSYLIREIVLVFVNRAELLPDGETVEEHQKYAKEEADIVNEDRANTDKRTGGLFKGCFKSNKRRVFIAIHDPSDHVDRCPRCLHEVEDGFCATCLVRVRSQGNEDDELDYDLEDMDADPYTGWDRPGDPFSDSDADSDIDGDDDDGHQHSTLWLTNADISDVDSEDDDEDDDDDTSMNSFVVNDGTAVYVSSSSGSGSDSESDASGSDNTEIDASANQRRQHSHARTARIVESEDDDDDSSHHHREQVSDMDSSNPDQSSSDEGEPAADSDSDDDPPIRTSSQRVQGQRRGGVQRSAAIDSDEDDVENESESEDGSGIEDEEGGTDNTSRSATISPSVAAITAEFSPLGNVPYHDATEASEPDYDSHSNDDAEGMESSDGPHDSYDVDGDGEDQDEQHDYYVDAHGEHHDYYGESSDY